MVKKRETAKVKKLRSEAASEDRTRSMNALPKKAFKKAVSKALSVPSPEKKAAKTIKETRSVKKTAQKAIDNKKRVSAAHAAKQKGVVLHPSEEKRVARAANPEKRGRGRPRTKPLPDPAASKRGRGRPKSAATMAKEAAKAAGTYKPKPPGRPRSAKPKEEKPKNSPVLQKKGKSYTPSQVRVGIMMGKLTKHRTDSSQDGHNEYGLHKRGNTLVSYIPKEGSTYKVMRRTIGDKERSVSVTKTQKSADEHHFKGFHSTRIYTSPRLHVTEHIHHSADPKKTEKTRLITKQGLGGSVENSVKTAHGRKSKVWYPGFMGSSGAPPVSAPEKTERSVASLPKATPLKGKRRAS